MDTPDDSPDRGLRRARLAALLILGSPCFAVASAFGLIAVRDRAGGYLPWVLNLAWLGDAVGFGHWILAAVGSAVGGFLVLAPVDVRIGAMVSAGIFGGLAYGTAMFAAEFVSRQF